MNDGEYYEFVCDVTSGGLLISVDYTVNGEHTVTGLGGGPCIGIENSL